MKVSALGVEEQRVNVIIDLVGDAEANVGPVLFGQSRRADDRARHIDTFVGRDRPAPFHAAINGPIGHRHHEQFDAPVVNENARPGTHIPGEMRIGHSQFDGRGRADGLRANLASRPEQAADQPDVLPDREFHSYGRESSEANPWALQILEDGDRPALPVRGLANGPEGRSMRFMGAMRKVQPGDIHSGIDQAL